MRLFFFRALTPAGPWSGLPAAPPPVSRAVTGSALRENDHRADHLRATLTTDAEGRLVATPFPVQDSAMLWRLASADALVLRAPHPRFAAAFVIPSLQGIDERLIGGAVVFGLGWGLPGLCPGPAIASLVFGYWPSVLFVLAMAGGMALYELSQKRAASKD